ncbi:hypothetical protein [Streptomyces antibioticus]
MVAAQGPAVATDLARCFPATAPARGTGVGGGVLAIAAVGHGIRARDRRP